MRNVDDLTRDELVAVVGRVQAVLYAAEGLDSKGRTGVALDRDKVWDCETIEAIDKVLIDAGLSPATA